ncbi:hypothetical protein HDU82_005778 [Entophlyctis luteolus]|nr:hypothetical protein HDU82_005778 [Entophlyctis luteolus]
MPGSDRTRRASLAVCGALAVTDPSIEEFPSMPLVRLRDRDAIQLPPPDQERQRPLKRLRRTALASLSRRRNLSSHDEESECSSANSSIGGEHSSDSDGADDVVVSHQRAVADNVVEAIAAAVLQNEALTADADILAAITDIPVPGENGRTIIHVACAADNSKALSQLLAASERKSRGSLKFDNLSIQDSDGLTMLHIASVFSLDCLKVVQSYFETKSSKDSEKLLLLNCDEHEYTPVMRAILAGAKIENILFLLNWMRKLNLNPDDIFNGDRRNPPVRDASRFLPFIATRVGRLDVLQGSLDVFGKRDMINRMKAKTASGATILHYAASAMFLLRSQKCLDCLKFLVKFFLENDLRHLIDSRDGGNRASKGGKSAALYLVGSGAAWDGSDCPEAEDFGITQSFKAKALETSSETPRANSERDVWEQNQLQHSCMCEALEYLLDSGISPFSEEKPSGTTLLHLGALHGFEKIVKLLLDRGVPPTVKDKLCWTPLIYAHMGESLDNVSDGCLIALLEADPHQLNDLMKLMEGAGHSKIIKKLLYSLATKPEAYKFVNEFLRSQSAAHIELIEWFSSFPDLLDYQNKVSIFRRAVADLAQYSLPTIKAVKEAEFKSAFESIESLGFSGPMSISANFENEVGSGPGVTREFWDNLGKDMIKSKYAIFAPFSARDNGFDVSNAVNLSGGAIDLFFAPDSVWPAADIAEKPSGIDLARFAGKMCALAVLNVQLMPALDALNPHILRIVTEERIKFDWRDFESIDTALFKSWEWVSSSSDDDLLTAGLNFALDERVRGKDGKLRNITRALSGHHVDDVVCGKNKDEFVSLMAKAHIKRFRYKIVAFREGFTSIIPQKFLRVLRPSDLHLILCGVPTIDTVEWRRVTKYTTPDSMPPGRSRQIIQWFWSVVEIDMSPADRVLLLKFATGTGRAPTAVAAPTATIPAARATPAWSFTIAVTADSGTMLPSASTCFNLLRLPAYVSRAQLCEKLLYAIRHGSSGFAFV